MKTERILNIIEPNMLLAAFIHFAITLYGDTLIFAGGRNAVYYGTKTFVLFLLIYIWQQVPKIVRAYSAEHTYIHTYIHTRGRGLFFD